DRPAPGPELASRGPPRPVAARVRPQRHGQGDDSVPPGHRARPGEGRDELPERRPAPVAEARVGRRPGRVARVTPGRGPVAGGVTGGSRPTPTRSSGGSGRRPPGGVPTRRRSSGAAGGPRVGSGNATGGTGSVGRGQRPGGRSTGGMATPEATDPLVLLCPSG